MQKLLDLHDKRFDSRTTQFFTAQLVLAFEYLRHLDVVYRDLKPDNLVVDFNVRLSSLPAVLLLSLCVSKAL